MTDDEKFNANTFAKACGALLVEALEPSRSFAEGALAFRKLEAEFLAHVSHDEIAVREIPRRIAEYILSLAHAKHPPFEVCREAWNDLVRLGFSHIDVECMKSWLYADCCAYDERPDEGLAVLEPLIAKLEQRLEEARGTATKTEYPADYYESWIERLGIRRDALEAQKRGEVVPWLKTRREDEAAPAITPEEEQADALYDEFWKAHHAVFKTYGKSLDRSFADVAADYRRVEAEFVARAGEGEAFEACVLDIGAKTAEAILMAACSLRAPFQACRDAWDEFVRVGQDESWMYPEMFV
ncbi:hypothetical protein, partial [Polyangium sp. 15x6]|uniref:hypothetical protein n=1 Tax=Polyangium sp. 15x6 TaxID=3042687 RepID=UPI00249B5399